MRQDHLCGLSFWHPKWLQKFATTKSFLLVYGFLGTVQAMSYLYFVVTLTTIEKRFKIPSQTTGLILSGNEISQILLSLILSYAGGQRNRPRWIAWGMVFCALSCFVLALPHFVYGPGEEALKLTKEYLEEMNEKINISFVSRAIDVSSDQLCLGNQAEEKCDELVTVVPLVLIFLSQFILGIGNTLYYSLGQTYLDDNTKKKNSPMMFAYAMSLRLFGPIVGFFLGYVSLNVYIDPTKTPLIDRQDPRWLGAWWFGWTILGSVMMLLSGLIGIFPKQLPKKDKEIYDSELPKALQDSRNYEDDSFPLNQQIQSNNKIDQIGGGSVVEFPKMKDFPKALMRLLRNKLLMFNNVSTIFYILGASGYMTFLTKYIEIQFHKNASNATILVGPLTILGMLMGLLLSGHVLSKYKPKASKVLFWNIIIGFGFLAGNIAYMFIYCGDSGSMIQNGTINIASECNANCSCNFTAYNPVCHVLSGNTYFSPCHAGCKNWNSEEKIYTECSCINLDYNNTTRRTEALWTTTPSTISYYPITNDSILPNSTRKSVENITATIHYVTTEPDPTGILVYDNTTESTESFWSTSQSTVEATQNSITTIRNVTTEHNPIALLTNLVPNQTNSSTASAIPETVFDFLETNTNSSATILMDSTTIDDQNVDLDEPLLNSSTLKSRIVRQISEFTTSSPTSTKHPESDDDFQLNLMPGACLKDCVTVFYVFAILSFLLHWMGSSGRIGNLLVNYRAVSHQDKSFAQGLSLMLISLFALIPGPILFGRIIDSTCNVWNFHCGERGNCQFYDQKSFRIYLNTTSLVLTGLGVIFDILVWHYGKNLDLYGEREEEMLEKRRKKTVSPLLPKKI